MIHEYGLGSARRFGVLRPPAGSLRAILILCVASFPKVTGCGKAERGAKKTARYRGEDSRVMIAWEAQNPMKKAKKQSNPPLKKSNSCDLATTAAILSASLFVMAPAKIFLRSRGRVPRLTHIPVIHDLPLIQPSFRIPFLHEMFYEVLLARQTTTSLA